VSRNQEIYEQFQVMKLLSKLDRDTQRLYTPVISQMFSSGSSSAKRPSLTDMGRMKDDVYKEFHDENGVRISDYKVNSMHNRGLDMLKLYYPDLSEDEYGKFGNYFEKKQLLKDNIVDAPETTVEPEVKKQGVWNRTKSLVKKVDNWSRKRTAESAGRSAKNLSEQGINPNLTNKLPGYLVTQEEDMAANFGEPDFLETMPPKYTSINQSPIQQLNPHDNPATIADANLYNLWMRGRDVENSVPEKTREPQTMNNDHLAGLVKENQLDQILSSPDVPNAQVVDPTKFTFQTGNKSQLNQTDPAGHNKQFVDSFKQNDRAKQRFAFKRPDMQKIQEKIQQKKINLAKGAGFQEAKQETFALGGSKKVLNKSTYSKEELAKRNQVLSNTGMADETKIAGFIGDNGKVMNSKESLKTQYKNTVNALIKEQEFQAKFKEKFDKDFAKTNSPQVAKAEPQLHNKGYVDTNGKPVKHTPRQDITDGKGSNLETNMAKTQPTKVKIGAGLGKKNNNPGNLEFANQEGAVPSKMDNGRWAKFSTPEEGYNALVKDIEVKQTGKSSSSIKPDSSLAELIRVYAPKKDNNNTEQYIKNISEWIKVSPDTPIKDIPKEDLAKAIARQESNTKFE